jgi:hypothetical protein
MTVPYDELVFQSPYLAVVSQFWICVSEAYAAQRVFWILD